MGVAQTAATAARDHHALVVADEIGDQVVRPKVAHDRTGWNLKLQVLAGFAVLLRASAATARSARK